MKTFTSFMALIGICTCICAGVWAYGKAQDYYVEYQAEKAKQERIEQIKDVVFFWEKD